MQSSFTQHALFDVHMRQEITDIDRANYVRYPRVLAGAAGVRIARSDKDRR